MYVSFYVGICKGGFKIEELEDMMEKVILGFFNCVFNVFNVLEWLY